MSNTRKLLESINSNLNEKINKDNIEINKAIANVNRGKNADKVRAAGYDIETGYGEKGNVSKISNPKTGRVLYSDNLSKDEKKDKKDYKNQLDTPRKEFTTSRRKPFDSETGYKEEYRNIPKHLKVGKIKDYRGDEENIYKDTDELEAYSPNITQGFKKSISSDINDYKKSVSDEKQARRMSNSWSDDIARDEEKIKAAQKDLDRHKAYKQDYDNKADNEANKRKELLAKKRAERQDKANESIEESEMMVKTEEELIDEIKSYDPAVFQEIMVTLLSNGTMSRILSIPVSDLYELIINGLRETNGEAPLTEAGLANLRTINDFDDLDDFHDALEDDKETISNDLEELKPRLNLKGSVDLIDSFKDQIIKQVTLYNQ